MFKVKKLQMKENNFQIKIYHKERAFVSIVFEDMIIEYTTNILTKNLYAGRSPLFSLVYGFCKRRMASFSSG